jgi:hypothetical protein
LAARRAADRAKLLAYLAGGRAGGPATRAAGAPSTPSTPTLPQTRSERYALHSAEKSISKTLAEPSTPDGSERDSSALAKLVDGDDEEDDDDDDDEEVDDCSSGGDQRMEFQRRQRDTASSAMAQLKPPPLEIVFQPPTNDPGENNGVVADSVLDMMALLEPSPADSVMDDMFNAWRCGSCTYQNLGKAKGACNMCNDPHPIRAGLSLDPWEIGELEARSLRQVAASPPPDDKTSSDECHARQFCVSKSNEPTHFTIYIDCNGEVHMICADLLFFQKPSKDGFIPKKDLAQHAKLRLRKMSLTERESVYICLLCQDRIV